MERCRRRRGKKAIILFKVCGRERHLVPTQLNWVALILTAVPAYHGSQCLAGTLTDGRQGVRRSGNMPIHR
jgi:hypothetical protein